MVTDMRGFLRVAEIDIDVTYALVEENLLQYMQSIQTYLCICQSGLNKIPRQSHPDSSFCIRKSLKLNTSFDNSFDIGIHVRKIQLLIQDLPSLFALYPFLLLCMCM